MQTDARSEDVNDRDDLEDLELEADEASDVQGMGSSIDRRFRGSRFSSGDLCLDKAVTSVYRDVRSRGDAG